MTEEEVKARELRIDAKESSNDDQLYNLTNQWNMTLYLYCLKYFTMLYKNIK